MCGRGRERKKEREISKVPKLTTSLQARALFVLARGMVHSKTQGFLFYFQMRTKANIIRDDSGGRWSDELTGKVPSQPSQMTDEDFNIITYKYRYTVYNII